MANKAHVTNKAVAFDVGIEADAVDEADVVAADSADEADMADKPAEAYEAKINKANEAANAPTSPRGWWADRAGYVFIAKANDSV